MLRVVTYDVKQCGLAGEKNGWKKEKKMKCFSATVVLHMCFERFLLAFESRDLSQADKSIKRVFSFPN